VCVQAGQSSAGQFYEIAFGRTKLMVQLIGQRYGSAGQHFGSARQRHSSA